MSLQAITSSTSPDALNIMSYSELSPQQRIGALEKALAPEKLAIALEDNPKYDSLASRYHASRQVLEFQSTSTGEPGYLWLRPIQNTAKLAPGVKFIQSTGELDDHRDHKIHLNVRADAIPAVVGELSKLQDELFDEEAEGNDAAAGTFQMKALLMDKWLFDEEYDPGSEPPPRLVVYPSSYGLYGLEGTESNTDRDLIGVEYLKGLIEIIEKRLEGIENWKSSTYRARYHELFDEFSSQDGSIEVVRGDTVKLGNTSGR